MPEETSGATALLNIPSFRSVSFTSSQSAIHAHRAKGRLISTTLPLSSDCFTQGKLSLAVWSGWSGISFSAGLSP